jgi:hypothetical protein
LQQPLQQSDFEEMQKLVKELDQNNPEYLDALIVMLVSSI